MADVEGQPGWFSTTHWSLVLEAGDSQSPDARAALEQLCERYWKPVYSFVRRKGYDPEQARDLTQGFFAQLLDKSYVKAADPSRGRFRSFLLTSVRNYLLNEWDRRSALKRGGAVSHFSLDFDSGERLYAREPVDSENPEQIYERNWALGVIEATLDALGNEMSAAGKRERFEQLRPFLTDRSSVRYCEIGEQLGISQSAVKVAVHRMRRRFGYLLRQEVGKTVEEAKEVDEEIRHLLTVI